MTGKPCRSKKQRVPHPKATVVRDKHNYLLINRDCQDLLHNGHLEEVAMVMLFHRKDGSIALRPIYVTEDLIGVFRISDSRRISLGRVDSVAKDFTARWNDLDEQVELTPVCPLDVARQ
jgi:hypothetical protein